jgi:hypothetical protein
VMRHASILIQGNFVKQKVIVYFKCEVIGPIDLILQVEIYKVTPLTPPDCTD